MKKGLNASQLKIIAIIAMTIDHVAWGFVDMFTPLGQIMHVLGRLTIPIMCFFIAEGFRKTSSLKNYFFKMVSFALASEIPFKLFFGEEYGYRCNFIFDLTLALTALTISRAENITKTLKALLVALVVVLSTAVGGWPVFPIILVFIFYYVKDIKKQFLWCFAAVVTVEAVVIGLILLNGVYHFSSYDWKWYQWMYFFGFLLAIPLLGMYNGKRGNYPLGRMFFYFYYPCHFLVLWSIQKLIAKDPYPVYTAVHFVCLVVFIAITILFLSAPPSKPLIPTVMIGVSGCVYMFGYIMEVMAYGKVDIAFCGVIVEYLGETVLFIVWVWFISLFCKLNISKYVYLFQGVVAVIVMCLLITTRQTHLFYRNVGINNDGPFPRLELEYGPAFNALFFYLTALYLFIIIVSVKAMKNSTGIERKRILRITVAFACPWIAFGIKFTGLTGGYEIAFIGVMGTALFIYNAVIKFGYFNSVQIAGENAINEYSEGMLVTDPHFVTRYVNKKMKKLFPRLTIGSKATNEPVIREMLVGGMVRFEHDDRIFEAQVSEIREQNYMQAYMLFLRDMTEHYAYLDALERSSQRDQLTDVYNRRFFTELVSNYITEGYDGCFMMIDVDDFKNVNDSFGHDAGDIALKAVADAITRTGTEEHIVGRQGGDEFTAFYKGLTDKKRIEELGNEIITAFKEELLKVLPECNTSLSIGAMLVSEADASDTGDDVYKALYKATDRAMYAVKKAGKSGITVR